MRYIYLSLAIILSVLVSRFLIHPPNFTNIIALSFYIPAIFGRKYIPVIIFSFLFTDFFIGFHKLTFFTWGSVLVIGMFSIYFKKKPLNRLFGASFGAVTFFIITNLGVWLTGKYGYSFEGFITCYTLAIPFFYNTLVSTIIFGIIIELLLRLFSFFKFDLEKNNL